MVTPSALDVPHIQKRIVRLLMFVEIISGLGVAMGISVGALLTKDMAGTALSGVAQSAAVVGGALAAIPASVIMQKHGRRPGLALCYLVGAVGGIAVLMSAVWDSIPLLFLGFFIFGAGNTGKLQARYAAVDLAEPEKRGRQLSLVVWSTTIGAVLGPNLAEPLGKVLEPYGVPLLAGPFAFAGLAFLVGAAVLAFGLRPDPLLLAQQLSAEKKELAGLALPHTGKRGFGEVAREVWGSPSARLGMASVAMGHLVMVAVMSMTPIHIGEFHEGPDLVRIVGFVISLHIAGMYGLSPVMGWLTDRIGRREVILCGMALLVGACAVAGTAGHDMTQLTVGLVMLGLGWSATMVAGSTLFADSITMDIKAKAQGFSDMVQGLAGASAGVLSGVIVKWAGYPALTMLAALATIPLVALAFRTPSGSGGNQGLNRWAKSDRAA